MSVLHCASLVCNISTVIPGLKIAVLPRELFYISLFTIGESNINAEIQQVFPSGSSQASTSRECVPDDLMTRANRLLAELKSNPVAIATKNSRVRRRRCLKTREYQRNMVVIDFPGYKAPDVQILHEYDKVFEGPLCFNESMAEEVIREEITHLLSQKKSIFYNFHLISPDDFEFVRCVNRRIRSPDGKPVYDGKGLKQLYRSGSVYVRLTRSFAKEKVSFCYQKDVQNIIVIFMLAQRLGIHFYANLHCILICANSEIHRSNFVCLSN